MEPCIASSYRQTVLVTTDDDIKAPGLRALISVLVVANQFDILVCAPNEEQTAVSHGITYRHPISAEHVDIPGTTAYVICGTPADCASIGISRALFPVKPDLVVSGINKGNNCGFHVFYSGTVAAAREAFIYGVPALSLSYDCVDVPNAFDDYMPVAKACLPIITSILAEIKDKTYPTKCFLNVDFPADFANNKGFKLTKQGISTVLGSWKPVTPETQGEKKLFLREISGYQVDENDTDYPNLSEGYITVVPLNAVCNADDCREYFKGWLSGIQK